MTDAFQPNLDFTAVQQAEEKETFVVDLEGYEGPLHVLLELARGQVVRISTEDLRTEERRRRSGEKEGIRA